MYTHGKYDIKDRIPANGSFFAIALRFVTG